MTKIDKKDLEEKASLLVGKVIALSVTANDDLHGALKIKTNLLPNETTYSNTLLQISFLGSYVLLQRQISNIGLDDEQSTEFKKLFKKEYCSKIPKIFGYEDLEGISDNYDKYLKLYSEYLGNISLLLKEKLVEIFNGFGGKIKFINGGKNFFLKTALFIDVFSSEQKLVKEYGDAVRFPEDSLNPISEELAGRFWQEEL